MYFLVNYIHKVSDCCFFVECKQLWEDEGENSQWLSVFRFFSNRIFQSYLSSLLHLCAEQLAHKHFPTSCQSSCVQQRFPVYWSERRSGSMRCSSVLQQHHQRSERGLLGTGSESEAAVDTALWWLPSGSSLKIPSNQISFDWSTGAAIGPSSRRNKSQPDVDVISKEVNFLRPIRSLSVWGGGGWSRWSRWWWWCWWMWFTMNSWADTDQNPASCSWFGIAGCCRSFHQISISQNISTTWHFSSGCFRFYFCQFNLFLKTTSAKVGRDF